MKLMVKVVLALFVVAGIIILTSCSNDKQSVATFDTYAKQVQQLKDDNLKLEERIKTLENQSKTLNEELYRNVKRTEALEEVYDYVAKDNDMPGTGEEPPADALD